MPLKQDLIQIKDRFDLVKSTLKSAGFNNESVDWCGESIDGLVTGWRSLYRPSYRSSVIGSDYFIAGVYNGGGPTRNDGAFGKVGGEFYVHGNQMWAMRNYTGVLAATGHNELYYTEDRGGTWTKEIPSEYIITDPTAELEPGCYALNFGDMVNGPDISGLPGHSPNTTYGILLVNKSQFSGRILNHAYYGRRAWDISEKLCEYIRSDNWDA